jgi:hypothetical protein
MISSNPDVLYLWQAMKEPDWPQFKATPILPTVWSMKRK